MFEAVVLKAKQGQLVDLDVYHSGQLEGINLAVAQAIANDDTTSDEYNNLVSFQFVVLSALINR